MDHFIAHELASQGASAPVDFAQPEAVVAVETIGDCCGFGLLSKRIMERYPFVRVALN
jgi:tRNA(Ser,Leu) C12 N-acetylase TAN1